MNCKPNCLAVRVRASVDSFVPVGAIVEVLEACEDSLFHDGRIYLNCWDVRYKGRRIGPLGFRLAVPDADPKMIDDPGEDATDEMVALLGKPASQPSKEHA